MKKFLLFIAGLIALLIVLANIGPMLLLAASAWLLYVIFKKFLKTDSTFKKVCWVILGLLVLSFASSTIYSLLGVVAGYVLYLIYKEWKKEKKEPVTIVNDDPFTNFEKEWAELTK